VIPARYLAFVLLAPPLAIGWLVLAAIEPGPGNGWVEYLVIGNLIGGMFAQATLAAAWTVLGPLALVWRLPLALAWIAALIVALAINIGINGAPDEIILIMSGCVLAQWLLTQLPLWALAVFYDVRVRHQSESDQAGDLSHLQFGIRQLMILTAIVAVVLGIGRLLVANFASLFQFPGRETPIFVFLAIAGVLMSLPLLVAALLPRLALPATVAMLLFIALATAWELPLLSTLIGTPGGGPDMWHFIWINAFQAFWVLLVTGTLRLTGYRLAPRHTASSSLPA
jgi:hypothetical protein